MYATHPEMAKKWEDETPKGKKLPKKLPLKKEDLEALLQMKSLDAAVNSLIENPYQNVEALVVEILEASGRPSR